MSLSQKIKNQGFDSDSDNDNLELNSRNKDRTWVDFLNPIVCCGETWHIFATFWRKAFVFLSLNVKDIRQGRKLNYCLGLMSCFIVVVVTALMMTVLTKLPVLFLKLGESDAGEFDFAVVTGGDAWRAISLNYTKISKQPIFSAPSQYRYHSPRIEFTTSSASVKATAAKNCWYQNLDDLWNTTLARAATPSTVPLPSSGTCERSPCITSFCPLTEKNFDINSWFWMDSVKERAAGMGSTMPDYGHPEGIPPGYILVDQTAAAIMGGLRKGDTVLISGDVSWPLMEAFVQAGIITSTSWPRTISNNGFARVAAPFTILDVMEHQYGKVKSANSPLILSEYNSTLAYLAAFLAPAAPSHLKSALADVDPYELASTIYWNYPPSSRFERYSYSDYAKILAEATSFAGPIVTSLGFNQIDISVPIVEFMNSTRFFALFLGLIMSIIIVGLGTLSIVLVYSLLIVGVQTRQFELGVMRMVGFTRLNLVMYIVTGASLFAVPATILGLIGAQAAFIGIRVVMQNALKVDLSPALSPNAVGLGIVAGLAVPLLASIAPIIEVLSQSLPDALNTARGRIQAIIFDIETQAQRPINWTLVIFGTALVIFGFIIYYLFPLALFTFNLQLLFYIFFALLLGMLFGCILLAMNFDHFAQTLVAYAFFFIEREAVFKLVRSNLVAHRQRNRSNSLMFATAVGFIVFITVAFDIQIQSVKYATARSFGGQLALDPQEKATNGGYISYDQMQMIHAHLTQLRASGKISASTKWTWAAQDLKQYPGIPNATMQTLGRYISFQKVAITAAAPDFFEVADPSFLIVKSKMNTGDYTFSEYLYTRDGSGRALMSTYQRDQFGIQGFDGQNDMFQHVITRPRDNNSDYYDRGITLPCAILDATPFYDFSKFPSGNGAQDSVLSMPSWIYRSNGSVVTMHDTRYIHVPVSCSPEDAKTISASSWPQGALSGVDMQLLSSRESNLALAQTIVGFFFAFTQTIAMAVCFFALISTMSTNIYEQSKEIGIMRAIGTPTSYVKRIFLEEAFVLVFAACVLGTIVGTVVAYTMLIQRALFTQLPLPFSFPYTNVVVMFILSIIFSFLSTWGPISRLLNSPSVNHILRKSI